MCHTGSERLLLIKCGIHCRKNLRDSWICFDQTFLGLGLGKLFPARESLVSEILAGDGSTANPFFTVYQKNRPNLAVVL